MPSVTNEWTQTLWFFSSITWGNRWTVRCSNLNMTIGLSRQIKPMWRSSTLSITVHTVQQHPTEPSGHQRLFDRTQTKPRFCALSHTLRPTSIENTQNAENEEHHAVTALSHCTRIRHRFRLIMQKQMNEWINETGDGVAVGRMLLGFFSFFLNDPPFIQTTDPLRRWRWIQGRLHCDHLPRLRLAVMLPEEDSRLSVVVNERELQLRAPLPSHTRISASHYRLLTLWSANDSYWSQTQRSQMVRQKGQNQFNKSLENRIELYVRGVPFWYIKIRLLFIFRYLTPLDFLLMIFLKRLLE